MVTIRSEGIGTGDFLDGRSLRVTLYPDESLGFYSEPFVEGFQLPNVIVNGDLFWGKSDSLHPCDEHPTMGSFDWDFTLPGSYAYNNFADLVVNSSPFSGMNRIYKASKYKEIRFITVADFRLLWDSDADDDTTSVETEITAGKRLKIALLDQDGIWNIHPVDLAAYAKETKEFHLNTPKDGYPAMLRDPEFASGLAARMAENEHPTFSTDDMEFHLSRYRVRPGGKYLHQIGGELVEKTYRQLKVFCED